MSNALPVPAPAAQAAGQTAKCGKLVRQYIFANTRTVCIADRGHGGDCVDFYGNVRSPSGVYTRFADRTDRRR